MGGEAYVTYFNLVIFTRYVHFCTNVVHGKYLLFYLAIEYNFKEQNELRKDTVNLLFYFNF
jgi:hypothetical protein